MQILRVGFNIISVPLYIMNSKTGNLLVTLGNIMPGIKYDPNDHHPSNTQQRRSKKRAATALLLAQTSVNLNITQFPWDVADSLGCSRNQPSTSWTCANEQVIIFLVGTCQHFPGLDLMGVNVFTCLCCH